ncbi:DGQHR domain-containing protein [Bradyrhizobium manausense]|uniref:DGQHR domain-containing protein n=1 Tax=Bradyrhizobium manausense TaxID=989370 RepID=UPI001BA70880|nr:DGQHR domain-containing protein [Bradyrhizobium manausense]MBR0792144.1 DGQHR domain-containing protein [Bradyrhizobium manausense]
MTRKSYPGLLLNQNKHRFYFATVPVDDLFPSCFVARRDDDPLTGFQRSLNEARADDIAKYLADGTGSIPSNIVLSAQSGAAFRYARRTKSISFEAIKKAFLVLDGQHRLWGYHKCRIRHRVPVAIYSGLSSAEEAKLFVDINTTQRGVPAALLLDIKHIAQLESDKEQILRSVFDRLNRDAESPLAGRLSPAKSITGKISRVTFNRAIGSILMGGVMSETGDDQRYKLIRNYLNAFDAELEDSSLLARSTFFEAIFAIFDQVIQIAISTSKNVKPEAIRKIIRPLARLSYLGAGGRALLDKKAMTELMQSTLRAKTPISNEML